jgi:hypothetical protein
MGLWVYGSMGLSSWQVVYLASKLEIWIYRVFFIFGNRVCWVSYILQCYGCVSVQNISALVALEITWQSWLSLDWICGLNICTLYVYVCFVELCWYMFGTDVSLHLAVNIYFISYIYRILCITKILRSFNCSHLYVTVTFQC